jgi:hypothetical protein
VVDVELEAQLRGLLRRDDDYAAAGKPVCDWDDPAAREALVDALVREGHAVLAVVDGRELAGPVAEAAQLLAVVAGQDVEAGADGVFRIARRVARDRVISTVDTEARHGHKSRNRTFDGYKAHLSVDPDEELIDQVAVTAANVADRDAVDELLAGDHDNDDNNNDEDEDAEDAGGAGDSARPDDADDAADPHEDHPAAPGGRLEIFGDSAYADAGTLDKLGTAGHTVFAKVPPTRNSRGLFSKDRFGIDLAAQTVTCPAAHTVAITPARAGGGKASFKAHCGQCPLRARCTTSATGRSIAVHPREAVLQTARAAQNEPAWRQAYRATRPTVERKIAHFVRRGWGGRKARCRGQTRIVTDVLTRAAVLNLARLAVLGLRHAPAGWTVAPVG